MEINVVGLPQRPDGLEDPGIEIEKVVDLDVLHLQRFDEAAEARQVSGNVELQILQRERFAAELKPVARGIRLELERYQSAAEGLPRPPLNEALDASLQSMRYQKREPGAGVSQPMLVDPPAQRLQWISGHEPRDEWLIARMTKAQQPLASIELSLGSRLRRFGVLLKHESSGRNTLRPATRARS